ncbi:hypothetical protein STRTUCAR8_00005, partial [Streptomyces turgidiscabies Car8]
MPRRRIGVPRQIQRQQDRHRVVERGPRRQQRPGARRHPPPAGQAATDSGSI